MSITAYEGPRGKSYQVRVDRIDSETGRRKQIMKTFKRRKDAERFEVKWKSDKAQGTTVDPIKMTVAEFLLYWLETSAKPRVRPSTYASYESIVKGRIVPNIGHILLQQLTALQVQGLYMTLRLSQRADKKKGPLSARTVRYVHAVLRMALKQAERWNLVAVNVATRVDPPKAERPHIAYWTKEEAQAFLKASDGDGYGAIWNVALNTGMRIGELRALLWNDVDLVQRTIRVRASASNVRSDHSVGDPKSRAGFRSITIPADTVESLKAHRDRQGTHPVRIDRAEQCGGLVFASDVGTVIDQRNLTRRFKELVLKAGVKRITFHGMRHTHATLLLLEGVDLKTVSTRLGHASIQITADTYLHVLPELDVKAADAIARALAR